MCKGGATICIEPVASVGLVRTGGCRFEEQAPVFTDVGCYTQQAAGPIETVASFNAKMNSSIVAYSWDDIAVFLALYRERTTGRAAQALGCSQPTVVRRISALEESVGLTLFTRTARGLDATEAALALLPLAQQMEQAADAFEGETRAQRGETSQRICLTLLDHFEPIFVTILRAFRQDWPEVRVELLASDRIYDLSRGEADIAIRGRSLPQDDGIVTRQLPDCAWTLYASVDTPATERPSDWQQAAGHLLAFPDGAPALLPAYRKLAEIAATGAGAIRCSNYNAIKSLITSGTALSVLPVTVGDNDHRLARCFPPPAEFDVPIYLLGRRVALRRPHIRALFERIHEYFASNPSILTGRD
jgi:DNA-binding transcriptional LysR family regulator